MLNEIIRKISPLLIKNWIVKHVCRQRQFGTHVKLGTAAAQTTKLPSISIKLIVLAVAGTVIPMKTVQRKGKVNSLETIHSLLDMHILDSSPSNVPSHWVFGNERWQKNFLRKACCCCIMKWKWWKLSGNAGPRWPLKNKPASLSQPLVNFHLTTFLHVYPHSTWISGPQIILLSLIPPPRFFSEFVGWKTGATFGNRNNDPPSLSLSYVLLESYNCYQFSL